MSVAIQEPKTHASSPAVRGVTAEQELWAFAAQHDIELSVRHSEDGESMRSFGTRDDGGFVIRVTPDVSLARVLEFAHTVIDRHEADAKVFAVEKALAAVTDGKPGFAELSALFTHSSLWKLNGAGQFIKLIEATLTGMRQETAA